MEYNFRTIEKKWQQQWQESGVYKVPNESDKPKCYVLDMFPYPSGAGLHVGHPLGYIASDIYARFKRLKGFNVLHPMGYDAFGLPAEQYAIEHGIHPAISTENNINNFRKQLDNIGFSFDWSREVRTSDPHFYKWTQWIFLQLFKSFYNRQTNKAESIASLVALFEKEGNKYHECPGDIALKFSADEWQSFDEKQQQDILMNYRIAYCGFGEVNWCEALGTVLANDEVINGVSERGGYPVVKKKLRQWYLRITEYADRLLEGLQRVDFSEAMKEMQSNWIGKSTGAEIDFKIQHSTFDLRVYTTRPDTIFGVDFMVIAPEHELVDAIKTAEQTAAVDEYISYVKSRSERERMAEKKITGVFTGAYALNPFDKKPIPIWISEYVLAGYGTGAIMAVPCGDERDFKFAKHFNIPITNIIGEYFNGEESNDTKGAILQNSGFINGMQMREAINVVVNKVEELGIGKKKINYKMRDAAFSRQRYWGEPFPIVWKNGIAYPLSEDELPLELPYVDSYQPGLEGEGPLSNLTWWVFPKKETDDLQFEDAWKEWRETNTMPGYAGSSWYFLRYMDPKNEKEFCDRKVSDYWNQVDLYIGGTEHAVGHLLYSRMWTKCLCDLGLIGYDEPYKKLVNQGMIQGVSQFVFRYKGNSDVPVKSNLLQPLYLGKGGLRTFTKTYYHYTSSDLIRDFSKYSKIHVPIEFVDNNNLDVTSFYHSNKLLDKDIIFYTEDGYFVEGKWYDAYHNQINSLPYKTIGETEKMSKSKFNTVDPTDLVNKYGADTFRMYEMFLGPVEQSKPWDTKGIEGVHRFLKKLWRLFFDENKIDKDRFSSPLGEDAQRADEAKNWNDEKPTDADLKVLHKAIKKIEEDTERFSFNTAVSAFMVCVNDLTDLKCNKKEILQSLLILLAPYAPHVCEELWQQLGNTDSILNAPYPKFKAGYIAESTKEYPVSINGKLRTTIKLNLSAEENEVQQTVLANEIVKKWVENKPVKKFIFVKNKMVNVVV